MGSKRFHAEVEASSSTREAASKKRKSFHHNRPKDGSSAPAGQSLSEIKKRARDIERRFARGGDIPSDVQRNLEKELAHCKRQIEDLKYKKKRNEMISRYHKVRFFERQKAERLRKQLKKRLDVATEPEEKAQLEEDLHRAEVDCNYTRYFPFMERYIALYAAGKSKEDAGEEPLAKRAVHSERPPVWEEIEEAMVQGQMALERIQERRPDTDNSLAAEPAAGPADARVKKSQGQGSKPEKAPRTLEKAGGRENGDKKKGLYAVEGAEEHDSADGVNFFDF